MQSVESKGLTATQRNAIVRQGHVKPRGTTYHWRRKIPPHLIDRFQAREISQSLRTGDAVYATMLARHLTSASGFLFAMVQQDMPLTDDGIKRLARDWLRRTLAQAERTFSRKQWTREEIYVRKALGPSLIARFSEAAVLNDTTEARTAADAVLAAEGITLDKDSDEYHLLCRVLSGTKRDPLRCCAPFARWSAEFRC